MKRRTVRVLPRSWVSGTKRRTLVIAAFVGVVTLWAVWQHGGEQDDQEIPPWSIQARRARGVSAESEWVPSVRHADRDHAEEMQIDGGNHLKNGVFAGRPLHHPPESMGHVDAGVQATAPPTSLPPSPPPEEEITFEKRSGKSCQNYAEDPVITRDLVGSKKACIALNACNAIECLRSDPPQCTLRQLTNDVDYAPVDCYVKMDPANAKARVHPDYNKLLKEYPFQQVTTQTGQQVNIILVRAPFGASGNHKHEQDLYEKYRDSILFLGISSFEEYPLDANNPFSPRIDSEYFLGAFPGFLHMMRHPDRHFPPHVKTILMSQSDFQLPKVRPETLVVKKKYDFTYAATWPLGPRPDTQCWGWAGYCKNWSFVSEALPVLCGEFNLTGVLVATSDKEGVVKCAIPPACKGKIIQTSYINQHKYFDYLKHSRFALIPQVHDASPRVSTQALTLDVPMLMNRNIAGGWKYINKETGESFNDMADFRDALTRILDGTATPGHYHPRKWVLENYDNENSGKRLLNFVMENFGDRVHLPKGTTHLYI